MTDRSSLPVASSGFENPLDDLLGYQLRRASTTMLAGLARSLEDIGLKPTEASVLLLIGANPGVTQSEIGRLLAIKRANMAPIAAMLSARGLIARTRPDGRSQGLQLSDSGLVAVGDIRRRMDANDAGFLPDLTSDERTALTRLLRRVWAV